MFRGILVLSLALLACHVAGYGESDQNGLPVWQDRANHLLVNAVRMDPTNYKALLWNGDQGPGNILTSYYPAQPPLYLVSGLTLSSYNHSLDMATYRPSCFQHPTCGTNQNPFTRIAQFYSCGTDGENIAAGPASPVDVNNMWLCDAPNSTAPCAVDGSGSDGHRSNIMSSSYTAIGVGFATSSSSTYTNYWTQDFGNCLTGAGGPYTGSIYGGSHYSLKSSSNTKFSAAWSNSAAPSSATVVIAGTSSTLSVELGSSTRGIYTVSLATSSIAACSQYYFQFGSARFPDTGYLVVVGSSCTAAWVAGSSSATTTAAPTSAATTAAPTTKSSSTAAPTTQSSGPTSATTAAPTTKASSTTAAPTTSAGTTAAPSPSSGVIFDTKLENTWTYYENGGGPAISVVTYSSQSVLQVTLGNSSASNNFFWFAHSAAVSSTSYTNLVFSIASTTSCTVNFYFNGEYTQSTSVTTSFSTVTTPLSQMLQSGHTTVGSSGHQLVFSNPAAKNGVTILLYNVKLV